MHEIEDQYRNGSSLAGRKGTAVTAICGKIEAELAELDEAREYLASYGLKELDWSG